MKMVAPVSNLTIRKLDPGLKERLRIRAALHGHSMEEEARRILGQVLTSSAADGYDRLHRHFADLDDVELTLPERQPGREPPRLE